MRAYCYNKLDFERICMSNGWDDAHLPEDTAFISICCLPDVVEHVLGGNDEHYFKECHPTVINVEFDDITDDSLECEVDGEYFMAYGMDMESAERMVKFINDNAGKEFIVHCRAGKSRSQAVVRYITDFYPEYDMTNPANPCKFPNVHTYRRLVEARERLGF